jgi:hypothetical protein
VPAGRRPGCNRPISDSTSPRPQERAKGFKAWERSKSRQIESRGLEAAFLLGSRWCGEMASCHKPVCECAGRSEDLLPLSPPSEKASAHKDEPSRKIRLYAYRR